MVSSRGIRRSPDDGADLLLWEEGRDETGGHGFVIETSACDNPDCPTVALAGYAVRGAEGPFANVRDRVAGSSPTASVLFDTRTGKLRFDADRRREDVVFAAFLEDHLDETIREILGRRWRQAKGLEDRTSWREKDWSWWEMGELVPCCEVFPDGRDLMVQDGDKAYWAIDLYCTRPGCDCRQVLLDFRIVGVSKESLGTVRVSYDGSEPLEVDPESASRRELERLYRALDEREDLRAVLRRRHEELKEVGEEIARLAGKQRGETEPGRTFLISGAIGEPGYSARPLLEGEDFFDEEDDLLDAERPWWETRASPPILRAAPKIGRNDPCPCGSGKKYKRCCLRDRAT